MHKIPSQKETQAVATSLPRFPNILSKSYWACVKNFSARIRIMLLRSLKSDMIPSLHPLPHSEKEDRNLSGAGKMIWRTSPTECKPLKLKRATTLSKSHRAARLGSRKRRSTLSKTLQSSSQGSTLALKTNRTTLREASISLLRILSATGHDAKRLLHRATLPLKSRRKWVNTTRCMISRSREASFTQISPSSRFTLWWPLSWVPSTYFFVSFSCTPTDCRMWPLTSSHSACWWICLLQFSDKFRWSELSRSTRSTTFQTWVALSHLKPWWCILGWTWFQSR